jgi:ATP-dependent DNA ligase
MSVALTTLGPIYNNQNGKVREWSITLELFNAKDEIVKMSKDVISTTIEDGYYATYYTTSGYSGMKMTQSASTAIRVGKNLGKKNATNVLTQAYKECESKYAAKIKAGYSLTMEAPSAKSNPMPFPMAVKSWKDHKAKLQYPVYIQPKLDGVRMLARFENNSVKIYTRRLHDVAGFEKVKSMLSSMYRASNLKTFIVDGELYAHGMNLQTISGIVRNVSIEEEVKDQLQYHVFDFFDVKQADMPFDKRHELLTSFVQSVDQSEDIIIANPTVLAETDADAERLYNQYVKAKYEGVIYKSNGRGYEFDYNKEKRSSWYLKRKKQEDAEFAIIGFGHGKGKDIDCIVFELQGPNDKTFNCVPNGTYDYRKELYAQAVESFDTTFKGKLAKVLFDDLSKDGVPLRGRIVQIGRDLSFD